MRHAVAFTFRMGQKLTQSLISSGALNIDREVAPPEHRSKEARSIQRGKKKRLCESPCHDFGSKKNEARLK